MSVQKKSLISSRKSTNVRTADDSGSSGQAKNMKVAALRHSALKKTYKKGPGMKPW